MSVMNTQQIKLRLNTLPDWTRRAQTIQRTYAFNTFTIAIDFVKWVAKKADKMNHHPDIDIRYDHVSLKLTSHDEGGLTEKDFALARQCDEVFSKLFGS